MSVLVKFIEIAVPMVIVPVFIFCVNCAWRYKQKYSQTAAADFILAVLIFDLCVMATSDALEPFVRNAELRTIIVSWHILLFAAGSVLWGLIIKLGEPVVARYYANLRTGRFPLFRFTFCWMGVLALVASHVIFFFIEGPNSGSINH